VTMRLGVGDAFVEQLSVQLVVASTVASSSDVGRLVELAGL
jgi:hypothetical protein